jgi:hypothetical protein
MKMREACRLFVCCLALGAFGGSARALTTQQCSVKYKEAQKAGALGGMKWSDYRKAQCGSDTPSAQPTAVPAPTASANPLKPAAKAAPKSGSPVFPTAISSKYANEKPRTARMRTCRDQFQANKASGGDGGLPWIKKGGGYYSACNSRLKG